ncbi:hypothetical protein H6P81_017355 [Aristolochia fimbriata]|uniref:Uncharacterized protein n=1 Tax=Aristolochia fimbriata TaxID=158543 RepID=A0AAV7DZA9_ARIFI|nr:hypothetical protein H6P81_017355 [Aristolochia fimbriata]
MAYAGKIELKLMVDRAKNRVVCAECDSKFVDVLFSFLTMPMAEIIHLSGKKTKMGCMDGLYQSVEGLDERFFQSKACKSMLLRPRSSIEFKCANLAVNYVAGPTGYYLYGCSDPSCGINTLLVSYYKDCQCSCGRIMDRRLKLSYPVGSTDHGVFVQGKLGFLVRDDLQVIPLVATSSLCIMKKIGIKDGNSVEGRDVKIGSREVLRLLKCSLHSRTALTDALLSNIIPITGQVKLKSDKKASDHFVKNEQKNKGRRTMKGKLVMNKSTKQVLYLEAREDLVNQILSFLTFPLGSVLKVMKGSAAGSPFLGSSVSNIYSAAEEFSTGGDNPFKSEESKSELVSPRLGCFMGCDDQLLIHHLVDEADSQTFYTDVSCHGRNVSLSRIHVSLSDQHISAPCSSIICTRSGQCYHGAWKAKQLKPINPKLPNAVTVKSGGFVKMNTKYMITDDLSVKPLISSSTVLLLINKNKVTTDELEEQDISIGEEEVARILRASLTSKTVFTDVFFPAAEKGKWFRSGSMEAE